LIHFDFPLRAEKVALQFHIGTTRAIAFPFRVPHAAWITPDFHEPLTGRFTLLIYTLKFEVVEPNPATAVLTGIHCDISDLELRKLVEASRAFHG